MIAAVYTQPASPCFPAELATQSEAHTKDVHFPDVRVHLNDVRVTDRQAITLLMYILFSQPVFTSFFLVVSAVILLPLTDVRMV